jgi:hypothetical protein
MLYLLAVLAGGAFAAWLYTRLSISAEPNRRSLAASGIVGAVGGVLLMWLIQVGIGGALNTAGTILVLLVIAITVIPVVAVSILGARKVNDRRISAKLQWERSHPHVSGLHSDRDE